MPVKEPSAVRWHRSYWRQLDRGFNDCWRCRHHPDSGLARPNCFQGEQAREVRNVALTADASTAGSLMPRDSLDERLTRLLPLQPAAPERPLCQSGCGHRQPDDAFPTALSSPSSPVFSPSLPRGGHFFLFEVVCSLGRGGFVFFFVWFFFVFLFVFLVFFCFVFYRFNMLFPPYLPFSWSL